MTYTIDESLSDQQFTPTDLVDDVFKVARRFESITIHHWGSFGQTHDGVNAFFVNGNPNTSAHFVVSDGRINCLVSPANAAWAAGNAYGNATSIHIEARPEATDGDYRTVSWLVHWLRQMYGKNLPLKAHREWSPTACPGKWDLGRVDREARAWGAPAPAPAPTPAPPAQEEEEAVKTLTLINDGSGKIWATEDFIVKWHVPSPAWIQHYLNIEKAGWIKIRRTGGGPEAHIHKVPAFGAEVPAKSC